MISEILMENGYSAFCVGKWHLTPEAEGILFSMGSRFGGHALFIEGGKLYYVYNFLGIENYGFESDGQLPTGKAALGVEDLLVSPSTASEGER